MGAWEEPRNGPVRTLGARPDAGWLDRARLCSSLRARSAVHWTPVGGVAERLNAPVLKTGSPSRGSWVRIPPPPPEFRRFPVEDSNPRAIRQEGSTTLRSKVGHRSVSDCGPESPRDERRSRAASNPTPSANFSSSSSDFPSRARHRRPRLFSFRSPQVKTVRRLAAPLILLFASQAWSQTPTLWCDMASTYHPCYEEGETITNPTTGVDGDHR